MLRVSGKSKILVAGCLGLALLLGGPEAFARERSGRSYARKGSSCNRGGRHYDRRHTHYYHRGRWYSPGWFGFSLGVGRLAIGAMVTDLPWGYRTIVVSGSPYYHCDGMYFRSCPYGYEVVRAPMVVSSAVIVPVVTQTSATSVVASASGAVNESLSINIPNVSGGYTSVTLTRQGDGYVGPQGEFYHGNPTVEQLRVLYGK